MGQKEEIVHSCGASCTLSLRVEASPSALQGRIRITGYQFAVPKI